MRKIIPLLVLELLFFLSFAQNTRSTVLTNAREKLGDQKFIRISKLIYTGSTTGINGKKIIAYQNELLTTTISTVEILKKGSSEQTIQVNADKNDPNSELIDTVIRNDFRPDDIIGYRLVQNVTKSTEPMKYSAEMIAMSLTFDQMVSGINVGEKDLFYIKFDDLKTILDEKTFDELVDACIP